GSKDLGAEISPSASSSPAPDPPPPSLEQPARPITPNAADAPVSFMKSLRIIVGSCSLGGSAPSRHQLSGALLGRTTPRPTLRGVAAPPAGGRQRSWPCQRLNSSSRRKKSSSTRRPSSSV